MQQEVQILEPVDILKAMYNSYLEKRIANEINVEFYKWKSENLSNGEDIGKVKENLQNSEHNIKTFSKYIDFIKEKLSQFDSADSRWRIN